MVVKLKPTWKIPTKAARDASGIDRGERGYGEAENPFETDRADFIGDYDPQATAAIYGNAAVGRREPPVRDPSPVKEGKGRR
jgi:hypothetical protein